MVRLEIVRSRLVQSTAILLCLGCIAPAVPAYAQSVGSGAGEQNARPAPNDQAVPAQGASPNQNADTGVGDIIVTAQKRSQSLNNVGMSIAAVSSEQLAARGISRPEDLTKIVPSLTVTSDYHDTPIYTLRGVGFNESTLAAAPTVSMYLDQVPLVFPIMARGTAIDLERLEVLKGPQGTTFGQNSTGGLINYIAAKPTSTLTAGAEVGVARFGQFDANAFISGPVSDDVSFRFAAATTQGGAWQRSATRDDELGAQRLTRGRLIVDARPTSKLKLSFVVNGWVDKGDTIAARAIEQLTTTGNIISPGVGTSISAQQRRPSDPRIADWNPDQRLRHDDWFAQGSVRGDYDLSSNVQLASITSYADFRRNSRFDGDGTDVADYQQTSFGKIKDFYQELRLSGEFLDDRMHLTTGGSYQRSKVTDIYFQEQNPAAGGLQVAPFGSVIFNDVKGFTRISTLAAYLSGDYRITDRLQFEAGARYTDSRTHYRGCTADNGDGTIADIFGKIQQFALGVQRTTAPGQCVTLLDNAPTPSRLYSSGYYEDDLNQNNVSWRANLNWKPFGDRTLVYGNISRGYKAGSFVVTGANLASQLEPVKQEQLTAYEVGFKLPLADRAVQINAAGFYYDYRDKQIRGRFLNIFGALERLFNIPRSEIIGVEAQIVLSPFRGLTASANGTYIHSEILKNNDGSDFTNFPSRAHDTASPVPLTGSSFPFTPKYSASADISYGWEVGGRLKASVGSSLTYQGRTRSTLTAADPRKPTDISFTSGRSYNDPTFLLPSYALLDLRASLGTSDGKYTVSVFGRNVTNKYYLSASTLVLDTITTYSGQPATYGVKLAVRY